MEVREIADKTGKNIKTLQTQIYRAKGMLKKLYRKEDLA
jgi:RNA polymerase sigma-70 factor (ECF subfamily)